MVRRFCCHQGCLGLSHHDIAIAKLVEGQPDTISRRGKARAGDSSGSAMMALEQQTRKSSGMQVERLVCTQDKRD